MVPLVRRAVLALIALPFAALAAPRANAAATPQAAPQASATTLAADLDAARAALAQEQTARALEIAKAASARAEKEFGAESAEAAEAASLVVEARWRSGEPAKELLPPARRALELREARLKPDDPRLAAHLAQVGGLAAAVGDNRAARPALERAAALVAALPPADEERIAAETAYADFLSAAGEPEKALPIYRRILAVREAATPLDEIRLAAIVVDVAVAERRANDYAGARRDLERALAVQERVLGPDSLNVSATHNSLGNLLRDLGDYAGALREYERSLAIRERKIGPENIDIAKSLANIAIVTSLLGDDLKALQLHRRALAIFEKNEGPDSPDVAAMQINTALVEKNLGEIDSARERYERARAIYERTSGPESANVARVLGDVALLQRDAGDLAGGRATLDKALAIYQKKLGPEHARTAALLVTKGELDLSADDAAAAEPTLRAALAAYEKALGPDSPRLTLARIGLARALTRLGRPEEALSLFAAARATAAKTIGADHWQYAAALAYGAETLHALGRIDDAIDAALAADAITRANTRAMIRALSEAQALRLLDAQETGGLDRALAFAIERPNERRVRATWDALIRSRAMVLDELAARRHALARTASPEVEAARGAYAEAAARSANLRVRGAAQDSAALTRPLIEAARADAERAERALAALSIDYRENADRAAVGLDDVAKALPRGAALVAYAIYVPAEAWNRPRAAVDQGERRFAAFVLRGGAAPQVVALRSVAEVDRLVERWRDEAAHGALGRKSAADVDAAYRAAAAPLAAAVWAPLAPLVAGAKTVYIVPEGTLSTVNFATLPGKGGRYLLETGPIFRYLSAERDLAAPAARGAAGQGLLVLGGAAFDAKEKSRDGGDEAAAVVAMLQPPRFRGDESDVCRGFEAVRFAPLPASGAEAQRIAELWGASVAGDAAAARIARLEGAAATEAAFRRDAPGRRVLHLATHGFFLGGACLRAADGRGIGGLAPLSPRARRTVNPLLFSGLALAGANARAGAQSGDDDGVLTAEEIATLDLGGVDWAVLSACDTGLGDVRVGEGVLGLRRAFQVAGARTVVMSLWPVQDERTSRLMDGLYRARLLRGLDAAEALAAAELDELKARRAARGATSPFYWGAFVAAE